MSRVSSPGIFVAPAGCLPAHWTAETSPTPIAVMLLLIAEPPTTTSSRVVGVETGRLVAERVLVIATIKVVIGASVKAAAASFVGVTSCGIPAKISAADTPSFLVLPGIVTAGIVHILGVLRRAVGVALAVIMSLLLRRLSGQVLHRVVDVVVVLRKPFVVLLGRSHLTGG